MIWVVRDICVYNGNLLADVDASLSILDGISVAHFSWFAAIGSQHLEARIVLDREGDFLQAHATFPVDFAVSGYALTAP